MSDIKNMGLIANLKDHIELYDEDSTMGALLRDAERLITSQGSIIAESNTYINNSINQEKVYLIRLQNQDLEIANLRIKIKNLKDMASRAKKTASKHKARVVK